MPTRIIGRTGRVLRAAGMQSININTNELIDLSAFKCMRRHTLVQQWSLRAMSYGRVLTGGMIAHNLSHIQRLKAIHSLQLFDSFLLAFMS
jgi:hypothetical protein